MIEEPDQSQYEQPRDESEQHPEGVQIWIEDTPQTYKIAATGFGGKVTPDDMMAMPCAFPNVLAAARWAGFTVHGVALAPWTWYEFGNQPPVYRPYNPDITTRFYSEDHPEVLHG